MYKRKKEIHTKAITTKQRNQSYRKKKIVRMKDERKK